MWTCPKCDAAFTQQNLSHSCVRRTVDDFLKGKPDRGVELYKYFVEEYRKLGPVIEHAVKTRIALMVQVRFAAVNKIAKDHIDGHLWLKEHVDSAKFYKVEHLGVNDHIHRFRLYSESDIDSEFRGHMGLAYQIGQRKHLEKV